MTDHLLQIYRQHGAVESTLQSIFLLFYTSIDVDLLNYALRQRIPHQACVYAPIPEVQLSIDPRLDLPGLAGTQCLSQYLMGKDEGSLVIPLPVEHP